MLNSRAGLAIGLALITWESGSLGNSVALAAEPASPSAETRMTLLDTNSTLGSTGGIAISRDGRKLLACDKKGHLHIWSLETGRLLHAFTLDIGEREVEYIAFSADGTRMASGGVFDQSYRLWNLETGHLIREGTMKDRANGIAFSPSGRWLATVAGDDFGAGDQLDFNGTDPQLWSVASGRAVKTYVAQPGKAWGDGQNVLAFSPNGRLLAAGGDSGLVHVWDITSQKVVATYDATDNGTMHSGVDHIAFSPDNEVVLATSEFAGLNAWRLTTPISINIPDSQSFAISPDSKTVLSLSQGVVKAMDLKTGDVLATPAWHSDARNLRLIGYFPDGKRLLAWSGETSVKNDAVIYSGTILLIDAMTGRVRARFLADDSQWATQASDGTFASSRDFSDFAPRKLDSGRASIDDLLDSHRRETLDLRP